MKTDLSLLAPEGLHRDADAPGQAEESAAQVLARIEAALARMDAGRYGVCLACARQIELHRLEADPAEAVCSNCDEVVAG